MRSVIMFKYMRKRRLALFYVLNIVILIYIVVVSINFYPSVDLQQPNSHLLSKKAPGQRVFDVFMYNNEAEMLYTRLWRLYDYVDAFVICVSNSTFTGLPKKVSFKPFTSEIQKYIKKIHLAYVPQDYCDPHYKYKDNKIWCKEKSQRDYGVKFIRENLKPTEKDILLVSDIDEIITRKALSYVKEYPPKNFYFIPGVTYFPYYFHRVEEWNTAFVVRYSTDLRYLDDIRNNAYNGTALEYLLVDLEDTSITHCSYCFRTIDQYKRKIKSFSHGEYNKFPYNTNDWIFKSHYCREKINGRIVEEDEVCTDWEDLIPDDRRLDFLHDPSYVYNINKTSYTEEQLKTLCKFNYSRKPFPSKKI